VHLKLQAFFYSTLIESFNALQDNLPMYNYIHLSL
jgi:hypothetical protein